MVPSSVVLPTPYLRAIAEQLRAGGVDPTPWLAQHGVTRAHLVDIPLTLAAGALAQLVAGAAAATGEPAFGLLVGARIGVTSHGMVGAAALAAGTLREAIAVLERFATLRIALVSFGHELHGRELRLVLTEPHPLGAARASILETVLLSVKNILDALMLGACRVRTVALAVPVPKHTRLAVELFGCPVRYGQPWSGLTLPAADIDTPLGRAEAAAFRAAAEACERELAHLTSEATTTARVRRLLVSAQRILPALPTAARLLGTTPRTLHRRLADEGTSYRALLDEVRHRLAVEHLRAGQFALKEVAYLLGYSDLANFRRAFKRWARTPPSEARLALQSKRE